MFSGHSGAAAGKAAQHGATHVSLRRLRHQLSGRVGEATPQPRPWEEESTSAACIQTLVLVGT